MKKRLLTGDRPTGKLHLGHYVGTIENRVKFQKEYECLFIIADLHMLTTKRTKKNIEEVNANAIRSVFDMIACGIDPAISKFYLQSELMDILGPIYFALNNLISVNRLNRVPSLKEMAMNLDGEMPFGLLGYPVLQAVDILGFKANAVPVGKDNLAHIEVTREIAKKFNSQYDNVFPIPKSIKGEETSLLGIDGKNKMSKSLNNSISLSDSDEEIRVKVKRMPTDPNRIRADIPGRVENNLVFIYHDLFNDDKEEILDLKERYLKGTVGDGEVKEKLTNALINFMEPIRERRSNYLEKDIKKFIVEGTTFAREEFLKTKKEVFNAMGYNKVWNGFK